MVKKILLSFFLPLIGLIAILAINLLIFNLTSDNVSEGTPIANYQQPKAALMVIDIQECTTGTVSLNESYANRSVELIGKLNSLAREANNQQLPVIYIRNEITNPLLNLLNSTMAPGSEGARLDRRLETVSEHVFTKKKGDAFTNPDLDNWLISQEVNHLYLTGLDAAHCVYNTLQGAHNRNYRITLITDAVISDPEEALTDMLSNYKELGVELISSDEFLALR
jgi:nicotinamidase-related amidase